MVRVVGFKECSSNEGKSFISLVLQGGNEFILLMAICMQLPEKQVLPPHLMRKPVKVLLGVNCLVKLKRLSVNLMSTQFNRLVKFLYSIIGILLLLKRKRFR